MAIVYSYPKITSPLATDVLVLTDTTLNAGKRKNKTKSIAMSDVATYVINSKSGITGSGTINKLPIFTASTVVGDSQLEQAGPSSSGLYQMRFNNADRFIINKPSSVTSGDPEFLIQQDGNYKVSFGWDDDGDGYGYIYNWAGKGLRLGAAGQNPQFELNTVTPEIISHTAHLFDGTAQFEANIKVNAALEDSLGNTGTSGQVLTSTGTGVAWATDAGGSVTGTGTTNYIAKWNTSSSIQDSIIFDNGTSVGIGTTSPQAKLHINSQQPLFVTDGNEISLSIDAGNYIYSMGDISGGENQSYMQIESAASKAFFLNSNVGIGTNSPTNKLDVYGNIGINNSIPKIILKDTDTSTIAQITANSSNLTYSTAATSRDHIFKADTANLMIIEGTGNVGIGTTNPTQLLHVNSTTSDPTGIGVQNSQRYYSVRSNNYSLVFTDETIGAERMRITSVGNVGIGTSSPVSILDVNGGSENGAVIQAANAATEYVLWAKTSNGTSRLWVGGDGNVGIGTNGPRSILEAKGNVSIFDPNNTLSNGDTLNGLHFYTDEYSYNPPAGRASTPISKILPVIDSSATDSFGLSFYTAESDVESSEKFRISSSGNVGVGTTSPASKLEVDGGDIEVDDSASGLILRSPNGTRYRIKVDNSGNLTTTAV